MTVLTQWLLIAGVWAVALLLLFGAFRSGPGMRIEVHLPGMSDHALEVWVLATIATGVMVLAGLAIWRNNAAEASAWTAVLMAIIGAIKERWQQRSIDRMGQSLADAPARDPQSPEQP